MGSISPDTCITSVPSPSAVPLGTTLSEKRWESLADAGDNEWTSVSPGMRTCENTVESAGGLGIGTSDSVGTNLSEMFGNRRGTRNRDICFGRGDFILLGGLA